MIRVFSEPTVDFWKNSITPSPTLVTRYWRCAVATKAKAALTELFQTVKNKETQVIVERIVADIVEIVRIVRLWPV